MARFNTTTITITLSGQVSGVFNAWGRAPFAVALAAINGNVFLQGAIGAVGTTPVSADFIRLALEIGSGDWTAVGSTIVGMRAWHWPSPTGGSSPARRSRGEDDPDFVHGKTPAPAGG